jgi:predicted CXXCH cytochrome family protein
MKQLLKRILLLSVLAVLVTSPVFGKSTTQNVKNTIHNMSSSAGLDTGYFFYESDNVDQVCVFCHTPHGGLLTGPLWNHELPVNVQNSFTHYNSATVSSYLSGLSVGRIVNDESLLCMSCHDGSVATTHLINNPNTLAPADNPTILGLPGEIVGLFGQTGGRIGASLADTMTETGNLSDDHPISFSYDSVVNDAKYTSSASPYYQQLRLATLAANYKGEGVRFFGTDNRVECSSCHDPHVDYETDTAYTPFLIRPNTGSDLCLACHIK